jgi:hypothetical protein
MATRLKSALRRELDVGGEPYMLTITPDGLKLTRKGRRKGHEIAWRDLVSGEAALAVALNASLKQSVPVPSANAPAERPPKAAASKARRKGSSPRAPIK